MGGAGAALRFFHDIESNIMKERQIPMHTWESFDHLVEGVRASELTDLNACSKTWHIVLDANGCFRYASEYYFEFTGFEPEMLYGYEFLTLVKGDLSHGQAQDFNDRFLARENIEDFLFRRTKPDGVEMFIISNACPQYSEDGEFLGYIARSQNVELTVNKAVLEAIFEILEVCPIGVTLNNYDIQKDGQVSARRSYANPAVAKLFGYSQEAFLGLPVNTSWVDDAQLAEVNKILNSGQRLESREVERLDVNQAHLWLEMTSQTLAVNGTNFQLIWHHDVTRRHKQNELLRQVNLDLEKLANKDGLTGVANRRRFDEFLENEWNRALRSKGSIGLLMIDIDYFKLFNDHYGHLAGDECLKAVGSRIAECCKRSTDFVARYGGEEFAVVSIDATAAGMSELSEIIRGAIYELNLRHSGSAFGRITVSIGSAIMRPDHSTSETMVIERADKALYMAKERGRNTMRAL